MGISRIEYVCKVDGCDARHHGMKGYCLQHYMRVKRYGDPFRVNGKDERVASSTHFWQQANITSDVQRCWEWQGEVNASGYPQISLKLEDGYTIRCGNRLAYFYFYDVNPRGHLVCHTCDNRRCINPHHLYLGSHQSNTLDRVSRNRQARGERIGQKFTTNDIVQIRHLFLQGLDDKQLGKQFHCHRSTIVSIVRGDTWKHIPLPEIDMSKQKTEEELQMVLMQRVNETSQSAVARDLGCSPQYIHQVVRGQRHISRKLAKNMGYQLLITKTTIRSFVPISDDEL